MTKKEHLLTCLSEEASEVIKDISKSLRFGLEDINPSNKKKNKEAIRQEIIDFIAVAEMLVEDGIIEPFNELEDLYTIEDKKEKVAKYISYAQKKGTIIQ